MGGNDVGNRGNGEAGGGVTVKRDFSKKISIIHFSAWWMVALVVRSRR